MDAWMKWVKENEASIVDLGSPLGKTKRINADGISDAKNEITAYTIVQAESHDLGGKRRLTNAACQSRSYEYRPKPALLTCCLDSEFVSRAF